ncbi:MAG: crotonase/enoyl-CoA hydratase family protein [Burkholderiaceae bacterium]|jgi:enoyl-CoA hydratase/carnithine racemase
MSAIDDTRVLVTIDQGVADVRLNRPDKLNALDSAMFDALIATGDRLRTLPGLRAVVLSGVGKAFCAGLDMGRFQAMAGEADSAASLRLGPRSHGDCNVPQYAAMVWRSLPVPVIAAVHGAALGGGLQIALGADIRLVSPEAKLGLLEIRWGIIPDMGAFIVLPELMPADRIRDLAYTGRTVGGAEAVSMGLATQLSDAPLDTALAMARDIASRNPDAIRASKALVAAAYSGNQATRLQRESDAQIAIMERPNQREAVRAQLEKRSAQFADPA